MRDWTICVRRMIIRLILKVWIGGEWKWGSTGKRRVQRVVDAI